MTQGILSAWLKKDGDQVNEGDAMFELETEKATVEVPAPGSGVLQTLVEEGADVEIDQVVAKLEEGESAGKAKSQGKKKTKREPKPEKKSEAKPKEEPKEKPAEKPAEPPPPPAPPAAAEARETPSAEGGSRQTRVPMSLIRKRTAERLIEARRTAAHLTTFNEIDLQKVVEIRSQYRDTFEKEHGIRIGFMSFFVKACCQALRAYPEINSKVDGEDIVYNSYYDIGVAISTDKGLLVPVVRDADTLSFAQIESSIADLATRARAKKLSPDELTGGTFTITNGGVFGSLLSTPIPAYPQTAILGMHAIKKRAVVIEDQIAIRPMMYVALTYDHRVIDGREAIGFLVMLKEFIEQPDKLLLEM